MAKSSHPEICEVVLVRHAHSMGNLKGILAGRDNQIGLSPRGQKEAIKLSHYLADVKFDAIYSSPLKRCNETLAPLIDRTGASIAFVDALVEMEYGEWSGQALKKLSKSALWNLIQTRPSTVRFPGGESFSEMSTRANQSILDLAKGKNRILVLSHGDVIKSIVAFHLGMPLDSFQRISIDPASITTIRIPSSQVVHVNSTSHLNKEDRIGKTKRDHFTLGGGQGRI
ncbi:MAG: histidine phosphatase family protein [Actinomycetota bacterium]